ncbi:MAG: hypothetical protein LBR74_03360 [Eubacterium sp.]|jgi:nitrate reductase gamma subunit|nr:hypothetical protein [Eubacterium sp.]
MTIFGFIFGVLMVLFGLGGSIFFERLMERTHNRHNTEKEVKIYRFILLVIFILGLYLTAMTAIDIMK